MLSVKMVQHAFSTVFGNLPEALKASVVPFAILFGLALIFAVQQPTSAELDAMSTEQLQQFIEDFASQTAVTTFFLALISIFAFAWVAVTWHRFILLEEYPSLIPGLSGRPVFRYIWRSFLAGLIIALAALPIMLITVMILGQSIVDSGSTGGASVLASVVFLAIGAVLSFVWLRIAIDLPGTATGEPVGFAEAWRASSSLSGAIFGVAAILVAFNIVMGAVLSAVVVPGSLVGQILTLIVQWVTVMIGVSILTSLYGHIIEGRDLT